MDVVVNMLKDLSTEIEQQTVPSATSTASDMSNLVNELTTDKYIQSSPSCVDWRKIDNIIQLTEKVKTVRFFASAENCQKGCVRCQLCFEYLSSRDNDLKKNNPRRWAFHYIAYKEVKLYYLHGCIIYYKLYYAV